MFPSHAAEHAGERTDKRGDDGSLTPCVQTVCGRSREFSDGAKWEGRTECVHVSSGSL